MTKKPAGQSEQAISEDLIRKQLDAIDRSQSRSRICNALAVVGALAVIITLVSPDGKFGGTNDAAMVFPIVPIIEVMIAVAHLRDQIKKNTRSIFRAIAEVDSKSK